MWIFSSRRPSNPAEGQTFSSDTLLSGAFTFAPYIHMIRFPPISYKNPMFESYSVTHITTHISNYISLRKTYRNDCSKNAFAFLQFHPAPDRVDALHVENRLVPYGESLDISALYIGTNLLAFRNAEQFLVAAAHKTSNKSLVPSTLYISVRLTAKKYLPAICSALCCSIPGSQDLILHIALVTVINISGTNDGR
ncbi:hypothetical protein BDD12DRAFT_819671 [Trichophaea hybrida]|nr:hypothetical protein BDD12DRAFT_819671 [Trichophaea hybrida]